MYYWDQHRLPTHLYYSSFCAYCQLHFDSFTLAQLPLHLSFSYSLMDYIQYQDYFSFIIISFYLKILWNSLNFFCQYHFVVSFYTYWILEIFDLYLICVNCHYHIHYHHHFHYHFHHHFQNSLILFWLYHLCDSF